MKTGELDYEHFLFLRDKGKFYQLSFKSFNVNFANLITQNSIVQNFIFIPLKKHVIDKYLHKIKK